MIDQSAVVEGSGYQTLSDFCKVALVILALVAAALGTLGDAWNKERKWFTKIGYCVLGTALLVAVIGSLSWWADVKVKDASRIREANAKKDQKTEDDRIIAAQQQTISIVLRQLPIEEVTLSFKRSEVASVLPAEYKDDDVFFHKKKGYTEDQPKDFITLEIKPHNVSANKYFSYLSGMRTGDSAIEAFSALFGRVCRIDISSEGIPEDHLHEREFGSDDDLTDFALDGDTLSLTFAPTNLSAALFDNQRVRLDLVKDGKYRDTSDGTTTWKQCLRPRELRMKINAVNFGFDSGYVPVQWDDTFTFIGPFELRSFPVTRTP